MRTPQDSHRVGWHRVYRLLVFTLPALLVAVLAVGLRHTGTVQWPLERGVPVSFNEDIRPILNEECLACHGGVRQSGNFSLLFASEALEPNESGRPAIVPGKPDSSELIARLRYTDPEERMPYESEPLSEDEIALLERWIAEGASWETHWAYSPPVRSPVPETKNASWAYDEIDSFVLARIEREGLNVSPDADCRTLMRRLSLDLVGLPPLPGNVESFCEDPSIDQYEVQVDRLLASPRFGERWASMWLDLARYADTKGYEKDAPRTIWAFRDWVIEAFNEDVPFDRFTMQQLAGDLLPDAEPSQVIATAFHRNTMNNDEGGTDNEEFRTAAVIDRVNTTWEVWMGTTMACVQCHSHPYDPFRQTEYYQFLAFFNNTADQDTPDESPTLSAVFDTVLFDTGEVAQAGQLPAIESGIWDTPVMQELSEDVRRRTYFFNRGNWLDKTEEVQPATPEVMHDWPEGYKKDRLGLARWIVHEDNPLTARVVVNRFWAELFGAGLVETLEDFGSQGAAPSHPALLDELALDFMHDMSWSVKALLKRLVMTRTYRQSSDVSPEHLDNDPRNRWLARASRLRLSAEQIRDQALAVSGLLSDKMYGPSVMPYQPDGIWQAPYSNLTWATSEGEDRYRRGVYTFWRRSAPYPSMVTFDSPSREVCVSRRIPTNTPLQALVTLNDPVFVEAAVRLAQRMKGVGDTNGSVRELDAALRYGFKRALLRDPLPREMEVLTALYRDAYFDYVEPSRQEVSLSFSEPEEAEDPVLDAYTVVANAILNLDEFVTRS